MREEIFLGMGALIILSLAWRFRRRSRLTRIGDFPTHTDRHFRLSADEAARPVRNLSERER